MVLEDQVGDVSHASPWHAAPTKHDVRRAKSTFAGHQEHAALAIDSIFEVTRLVLINGAPGSGKSTLAHGLAQDLPMTLALDVDGIKHSLGRWSEDPHASGLHARRLALALARAQLIAGYDVVLGQYLPRCAFIEDLERLAVELDARFFEFVLELNPGALAERLAGRSRVPTRPEHMVNSGLVGPDDADALVTSLEALRKTRPRAVWVDAGGSPLATLDLLRAELH
jgi:predicted kinase